MKMQHDAIGYPHPIGTPDPWALHPTPDSNAVAPYIYVANLRRHQVINDTAYVIEAIIVTISGVAWFIKR